MKKKTDKVLLFDRSKYTWLIAGLLVTAVGFLLMIGGGSQDPNVFSEDIFSFRRMTLAPILVLAGYGMQVYAILKKTGNSEESQEQNTTNEARKQSHPKSKRK
jgi:hypothetical protein